MGFHVPKVHYMIGIISRIQIRYTYERLHLHLQNGYIITDFSKDFLLLCSSSTHKYFRKASTCPAYIFFAYRVIDALTRQPSSRRSCTYGDVYQAWKPVPYTYLYLSAKILSGTICKHLSFCMPLNCKYSAASFIRRLYCIFSHE